MTDAINDRCHAMNCRAVSDGVVVAVDRFVS